jgi:hypothetical protein
MILAGILFIKVSVCYEVTQASVADSQQLYE